MDSYGINHATNQMPKDYGKCNNIGKPVVTVRSYKIGSYIMTIAENNELGERCRYLTRRRRALQETLNNLSEDDSDFENKRSNLQKNIDGIWMEEKHQL